jgi:nucleotide-binding universal stress UspA family protein
MTSTVGSVAVSDAEITRRIVVGVDGSEPSRIALQRAAVEATAHDAVLDVVHAWNFLDQPGPHFDPDYDETKARMRIDAFISDVLGGDRPADATVTLINDHPSPGLVSAADGAFMVIVGARGLGGFKGLLMGSVSQHVMHHASCPVLIVR